MDKKDCIKLLLDIYSKQSLFQDFKPEDMGDDSIYHILECFGKLDYLDVINIGYAIDYLLFYLIRDVKKYPTGKLLTELTSGQNKKGFYVKPLTDLVIMADPSHDLGINKFYKSIEKGTAFIGDSEKTMFSILLYQIYLLVNNFKKNYLSAYNASFNNKFSLIYKLINELDLNWDSLTYMLKQTIGKSLGFDEYHNGINPEQLIAKGNAEKSKNFSNAAKIYIKLIGLYISYQIHKVNAAPTVPNEPIYPQNEIIKITDPLSKEALATIKTPLKITTNLNTFDVPEKDLEVSVRILSDVPDEEKYGLIENLITLEELNDNIEKDIFINDLIKSETKLMYYKLAIYNKMKSDIENNLTSESKTMDPKIKDIIVKKLQTIQIILKMIESRISNIKSLSPSQKITNKRATLINIINDKENGILSIRGSSRENIRRYLYSQIYIFSKAPELYVRNFMNYTLMGSAGSGKTKIASVLAHIYNNLGILASESKNGKFLVVTRADLVGGHIGETAPKTRDYLEKMLEGVLLIDEAYQLSGCPDQEGKFSSLDYGQESITEIVNYVDKHVGLSVIIAAGYEEKIVDCFLAINEGMKRRFPNNMRLLTYSSEDLYEILISFIVNKFKFDVFTPSQKKYIKKLIENLNKGVYEGDLLFSNQAGDMLNLSNILLEDLLLLKSEGYTVKEINHSFQKFFANKGIYIKFKQHEQKGGNDDILRMEETFFDVSDQVILTPKQRFAWVGQEGQIDEGEIEIDEDEWIKNGPLTDLEKKEIKEDDVLLTYKTLNDLQRGIYRLYV